MEDGDSGWGLRILPNVHSPLIRAYKLVMQRTVGSISYHKPALCINAYIVGKLSSIYTSMNIPSSIVKSYTNTELSQQSLITTFTMFNLLRLSTIAAAIALPAGTMG